jgi:glycosyltransferase involved in cell wall biosynthesis
LKILYIAPEHVTGGFSLFAKGHNRKGNESHWITFFQTQYEFPEDFCFNLFAMPNRGWIKCIRKLTNRLHKRELLRILEGNPPFWTPGSFLEDEFYKFRDILNSRRIRATIDKYQLDDYDIYHFEQGIDPYRDGRWARSLSKRGKGIVCFYHGTDIRNRGVIKTIHEVTDLNLTSEIDLLHRIPGMQYLYLPIDTETLQPSPREPDGRIRICHAARNRKLKGSDYIERVVLELSRDYPIDWVMIENLPHKDAIKVKSQCDIYIDQITDLGGWGYGASSVEALALGLPTMTLINPEVEAFLGEHPFISVSQYTLKDEIVDLINDEAKRMELFKAGREWVIQRHGLDSVMEQLYSYYREADLS